MAILQSNFMSKEKIALYPGTFDPVTNGHIDVLTRALYLFDKVIVGVASNAGKNPMFDLDKRVSLLKEALGDMHNVSVVPFNVLTVDLAREYGAHAIIRGLRAVSDFEYEFQLAQMNRFLEAQVETVFLMPSHKYFYVSSSLIKQIACMQPERAESFVPPNVLKAFLEKK